MEDFQIKPNTTFPIISSYETGLLKEVGEGFIEMLYGYTICKYGLEIPLSAQHYNTVLYVYQQLAQVTHLLTFTLSADATYCNVMYPIQN